jgi:TPR repeat protein
MVLFAFGLLLAACSTSAPDPAQIARDNGMEVVDRRTVVQDGQVVEVVQVTASTPPPDPATFAAACAAGDLDACHSQGEALLYADSAAQAAAVWLAACDRGHAVSCGDLAYQYDNPYQQIPDREAHALAVGTKACELHAQPISCYLLANWYEEGRHGAPKDPAKAAALYRQACADGHHWACEKVAGR